jgi:NADPH:quinone reductase-like Zn-dependent oxidoreductase
MFAVTAERVDADDPLSALGIGERGDPVVPAGWTTVRVRTAALNHHDLWTLRGVGVDPSRLPLVLGCDAAGWAEDGSEVVVHPVIADPAAGRGDETIDPARTILSESYDGTLAERVAVPARNVVPKPAGMSWEEAACLPTAWLTAYRMLFTRSGLLPGDTVLVQGAGGGVSTALIMLAKAGGFRCWVTSRDEDKRARALQVGADAVYESGARLPDRVDAVMESVGRATWDHSLRSLRPGGVVVVTGATSGANPPADLNRVFFRQLSVVGSTMGTRDELVALLDLVQDRGIRPPIDSVHDLREARSAFERLASGEVFGKIVLTVAA